MHAKIGGMWTMMAGWGMVVHGGGWWCVEDGGGVCGQSSQACFHAASVEMDNLTLTRRSSTCKACAHVPPICIPRLPPPMALVPKNTKTNSTTNTKHNHHKHASAEDAPRQTLLDTTLLEITPVQIQKRRIESADHRTRCHAFTTSI